MACLKSFLYCEGVNMEITPNGPKPHLVGPLITLSPMFIPGMFSFSIFMHIGEEDIKGMKTFRVVFKKKDSIEAIVDTGNQNLQSPEEKEITLPEEARGFMINMDFRNVVIKEEGLYVSEVYYNDEKIGESIIYAKATEGNV